MPLRVEPHTKAVEDEVIDLILWSQNVEFGVPITIEQQPDLRDVAGVYQKGAGNFWVAKDGERVVGTIALIDIGGGEGALRKMFVRPQYRGKAHGTAAILLDTLLAWCRAHGIVRVYLGTIHILQAACRFYEKNGFVEIQKAELPASFPVVEVDDRFYRYDVPSEAQAR